MNSKDFLKEGFIEDASDVHMDHEVQMAREECYHAAEHALAIHKLLRNISEQQGLEGWVSSKITLANDYLNTVREHLEYELLQPQIDDVAIGMPIAENEQQGVAEGVENSYPEDFYTKIEQIMSRYAGRVGSNVSDIARSIIGFADRYPQFVEGKQQEIRTIKDYLGYNILVNPKDPDSVERYHRTKEQARSSEGVKKVNSAIASILGFTKDAMVQARSNPRYFGEIYQVWGDGNFTIAQGNPDAQPDPKRGRTSTVGDNFFAHYTNLKHLRPQGQIGFNHSDAIDGTVTVKENLKNSLLQSMAEGHADQQRKIFKKNGKPVGEVGIDRESSPGVGQWYMKCYLNGIDNAGYDSYQEAVAELEHCLKQGVAEASLKGKYRPRRSAFEKFKAGLKNSGYDMNAAAKKLEDLLAQQSIERRELDAKYADMDQKVDKAKALSEWKKQQRALKYNQSVMEFAPLGAALAAGAGLATGAGLSLLKKQDPKEPSMQQRIKNKKRQEAEQRFREKMDLEQNKDLSSDSKTFTQDLDFINVPESNSKLKSRKIREQGITDQEIRQRIQPKFQATDAQLNDPEWMRSRGLIPMQDIEAGIKTADKQGQALNRAQQAGFPTYQHQGQTYGVMNPKFNKGGKVGGPNPLSPQQIQQTAGTNIVSGTGEPITAGSKMLTPSQRMGGVNETTAGSVAGVVNPKSNKPKSKIGSLFGGTYTQKRKGK